MNTKHARGKHGEGRGWHAGSANKRGHRNVKRRMARSLKKAIRAAEVKQARGNNRE